MKLNLFKENVLQEENDFVRGKILDSARIGLMNYRNYINESIKVVQSQGTIAVKVRKQMVQYADNSKEIVWQVDMSALKNKEAKEAEYELFDREIKFVYLEEPSHSDAKKVKILDRNASENSLFLDVEEDLELPQIYIRANDYQLRKQAQAINQLLHSPSEHHNALLQLFNRSDHAADYFTRTIDQSIAQADIAWKVLTDRSRNGTWQQQRFVYKAIQTRDFALLEGPPGSGKTTAIVELILQLIERGKRVLLVSATHVAVDNVIHRILTTYKDECAEKVVPLRIGDKGNIRKESVKPYRLQAFIRNKKREIKNRLAKNQNRTESQTKLYQSLKDETKNNQAFEDIILNSANLVGGTMVGVLQYPKIKNVNSTELFDVMIVDESSKVTFLDFLVPALYAKKWILVGDVQQLSPYVEDDYINESIDRLLPSTEQKERIVKQFELRRELERSKGQPWGRYLKVFLTRAIEAVDLEEFGLVYKLGNNFNPTASNILQLNSADVVVCQDSERAKNHLGKYVFVKTKVFEGYIDAPNFKNRQKWLHYNKKSRSWDKFYHPFERSSHDTQTWKEMVGSRLGQYYEYRFNPELAAAVKADLEALVPDETYWQALDKIRKVALPSILELLQIGIGTTKSRKGYIQEKIIYEGFKDHERVKELKFESLSYQHRMVDAIAQTSRVNFYKNDNLKTANTIEDRTNFLANYKAAEAPVIWKPNSDKSFKRRDRNGTTKNVNPTEVKDIKTELLEFIQYAQLYPKIDKNGQPEEYEVAVLTFYRDQEYELKKMLRRLTGQEHKHKFFSKHHVKITLCTVDKFQGDEADLVLLSFAIFKKRAFYNNSNRLNVALTRARFKLVLYGNKSWLARKAMSEALQYLATEFKERIISRND
ncbi:MAG: AAA domain-containing protein [Aureispira sp.]